MTHPIQEYRKDNFLVSTDPARLDLDAIHAYLTRAYWATGRTKEVITQAVENSLNFGLYDGDKQIGLARVVTDYVLYAYLCDVYVLEEYRGQGLGKWMLGCMMSYPGMRELRLFTLRTRDAHGLYRQLGFTDLAAPDRNMELFNPAQP
ncbi:MAG: GNAT family N-acetyltransferase [Chloroflexi bacterium]|nr:GNAT family N-acetyltransferase [Chloroflexota bacterium]OJV89139.1 MAG: GNAT family N-acetyltransferase [Chloroflexi bacterium 54-19]